MRNTAVSIAKAACWPIRAALFHKDGRLRTLARRTLFDRDGHPRRLFERWLTALPGTLSIKPLEATDGRPTILFVCHDASGAALLPFIRQLSSEVHVVLVLIGGGPHAAGAHSLADVSVALRPEDWDLAAIAVRLAAAYAPLYAIADGLESCALARPLALAGVPVVALVHGLAGTPSSTVELDQACHWARHIVFPDDLAAASAFDTLPRLRDRHGLHVLPPAHDGLSLMAAYADRINRLGRNAGERGSAEFLASFGILAPSLLPVWEDAPATQIVLARIWRLNWSLWNDLSDRNRNVELRRPCLGFHPEIYALAHPEARAEHGGDPLAHWLSKDRPGGPWLRQVFGPALPKAGPSSRLRVALHGHFHFPEFAGDLIARLQRNRTAADLFLTTDSEEKAAVLRAAAVGQAGAIRIDVVPNRGRDLGPFLTLLRDDILPGGYDVVGHVHGKKSVLADPGIGDRWRNFIWDQLIGRETAMLDVAVAAFAANPSLGLLIAEDPHLAGWDGNRSIAKPLAARMGIDMPLPDFFDFPVGSMFLARPAALKPLADLDLTLDDYPAEPVPIDGTILHALERLIPCAAAKAGFETGGLHAPGSNW